VTRKSSDIVIIAGLVLGAVFGIGGTLVSQDSLRQIFWAVDGVGVIVATALLAVRFLRSGDDTVAAGFFVFALGESLLVSGTAAGLDGSVPSFGGGVSLWAAGLLLISLPKTLAPWMRGVGVVAALLFGAVATRIFLGEHLVPTSSPLPFFAYPFVVLTFLGWIVTVLKRG
jgi:uncharacterized membrane protein (UPF0136 family)